jgi:germination protein M
MRKKNSTQIIAAFLFIIILIGGIYVWGIYKNHTVPKKEAVTLYYYEPISMELVPQTVNAELPENPVLKIEKIVNMLKDTGSTNLFPVLNKDTVVNSVSFENGICTIDLNNAATKIMPLSVRREAIAVYGLVNTVTNIKGITAVQITVNGEKRQYFEHYITIDKPLTHISTELPIGKKVSLYFATPGFSHLVLEEREVVSTQNPVTLGKEILRELFFGSLYKLSPTFPTDTKLNEFYIKSGGIGVVDLGSSILQHPLGSSGEQLRVMSLVNTLTELPDINAVQILIDGKQVSTLYGSVDTSNPIPRFLGATNDPSVVVPYFTYTINNKKFLCPIVKVINEKNKFAALFNILKSPDPGFGTYLTKDDKLDSYKLNDATGTLNLSVNCKAVEANYQNIAKELYTSYKEFPEVNKVIIKINGELTNAF